MWESDFRIGQAGSLNTLANTLRDVGRWPDAISIAEECAALYRTLAQRTLGTVDHGAFQADLATSLSNLGSVLRMAGRLEEGLAAQQEAVALCRALAQADPHIHKRENVAAQQPVPSLALTAAGIASEDIVIEKISGNLTSRPERMSLLRVLDELDWVQKMLEAEFPSA